MSNEQLINNDWIIGLPPNARNELLKAACYRSYDANQRIMGKSDSAGGLYGVLKGEIRITATTFSGEELVFTRIEQGNWFGEIALLDGGVRTHDAHTITKSDIAIIPKKQVLQICKKYPEVYFSLVKLLCEHCRQAFTAIDDFLLFTPEQRMAKRILNKLESSENDFLIISQQELGAMVGISRQSTNKILKSWESKGWIKRIYRGIEVIERGHLLTMTGNMDK
jgi:CRP-like cAMP-binding protein